jgi:glyoxylase-like metal-dependent hydrolase (beta-lactamase superfamily II)
MSRTFLSAIVATFALAAVAPDPARAELTLDTFVAGPDAFHVTSTIILGQKDAVLIDAQFTASEAHRLVAKILESKRTLKIVYITHGHPDHFFGLAVIKQAFPKARIYAAPTVVKEMRAIANARFKLFKPMYGDNMLKPIFPSAYKQAKIDLEGQAIDLVSMEPGESASAVIVHVPSAKAVIAGDIVYNGVHPWMAETTAERRAGWIRNLDKIEALAPSLVIAGHRAPNVKGDAIASVDFTAAYVKDYDKAVAESKTGDELKKKVMTNPKYKDLALPMIVDFAVQAAFPATPVAPGGTTSSSPVVPVGRVAISNTRAYDRSSLTADVVAAKIASSYSAGLKQCYKDYLARTRRREERCR